MADLIINGKDAFLEWGVRMGDKFLDVLGAPVPMKEFIENSSRLEHGKRISVANTKLDSREITLVFTIEGESESDFLDKKIFYLFIGNCQTYLSIRCTPLFCQISGRKKYAPQISNVFIKLIIRKFL